MKIKMREVVGGERPRKGDKVRFISGDEGVINTVSAGYAYIDFGHGVFEPYPVRYLIKIEEGLWKAAKEGGGKMKVKIGDKVYDGEKEPVMVILSPQDKKNISCMHPKDCAYCVYPESKFTPKQIKEWMRLGLKERMLH